MNSSSKFTHPGKLTPSLTMNPVFEDPTADAVLKYISQILMEEESEDQTFIPRDLSLRAAERTFSDILFRKGSSSDGEVSVPNQTINNATTYCCNIYGCNSSMATNNFVASSSMGNGGAPPVNYTVPFSLKVSSPPLFPQSVFQTFPGPVDSSVNAALKERQLEVLFRGGTDETWKFHHQPNEMIVDFANNRVTPVMAITKESNLYHSVCELKERQNHYRVESELEARRNKQTSIYAEEAEQFRMFAGVLPSTGGDEDPIGFKLNEAFQSGPGMVSSYLKEQSRGSNDGVICRKNKVSSRELVDTRTLLVHCAEAVAVNDHGTSTELLTQIRQHSTPFGDGSQRLAHCFANALESRIAGTGNEVYATLAAKRVTAACILEAGRLFISACPFMIMSNFFAAQNIMDLAEKAARLHIIHFGVLHGFPWPSLIQHLSTRPGGPPVLRITGIEFSQTGYESASVLEDIGRYLASYCEKFNVPFNYNAISQKWENVQLEDLKIDRDEVTVVSSLYRFQQLLDESVVLNCKRDAVLNLIKRINPAIFIHGIINGAYNSPFFVSRFREALFHYTSLFDMLEANTAREDPERMVCEQEVFGREILNVISCEGQDRVERPEKYKQWQARNARAGLRQLPLKEGIMQQVREQVKSSYHKDFMMDQDGQWMLQGWKGRVLLAISCWKSA